MSQADPGPGRPRSISIVVPNRNGEATIGACLEAACAALDDRAEIVVVDDHSEDRSLEAIRRFPCRLVRLARHAGVSRARNAGARAARGELLLFIDADCLLADGALAAARRGYGDRGDLLLGGTYTPRPADAGFFGAFQSAFIHHFETKRPVPDYVAAHAMVIDAELFRRSGGFVESSYLGVAASVEDVELSHRLRRAGCRLEMQPGLLVRHVFRFTLARSLANAFRKSRTWTRYSLENRDLLADSGTASVELKAHVATALALALLLGAAAAGAATWPAALAAPLLALDLLLSRGLVAAWRRAGGARFAALATLYYTTLFAAAVASGAAAGALGWARGVRILERAHECAPRSGT